MKLDNESKIEYFGNAKIATNVFTTRYQVIYTVF